MRTILVLAIETEIGRLDRLEDLYRQKRIENRSVPSHWRSEVALYNEKERIMDGFSLLELLIDHDILLNYNLLNLMIACKRYFLMFLNIIPI